jgi:hypothetical protein
LIRYQNSFDSDLSNEEGTIGVGSNPRPSIFYSNFANINETKMQINRKPWLRKSHRYLWRFWFCISGNVNYKRYLRKRASRFGINSRSELDVFARIAFPVSFILFNILYWFYFLYFQR